LSNWRDRPSLVQALAVLLKFPQERKGINAFCKNEGSPETVALIQQILKAAAKKNATSMAELEQIVVALILQEL
jgi:hypothetical protein